MSLLCQLIRTKSHTTSSWPEPTKTTSCPKTQHQIIRFQIPETRTLRHNNGLQHVHPKEDCHPQPCRSGSRISSKPVPARRKCRRSNLIPTIFEVTAQSPAAGHQETGGFPLSIKCKPPPHLKPVHLAQSINTLQVGHQLPRHPRLQPKPRRRSSPNQTSNRPSRSRNQYRRPLHPRHHNARIHRKDPRSNNFLRRFRSKSRPNAIAWRSFLRSRLTL